MMDDYLNHLISSSTWADGDARETSSWGSSEPGQPNMLLSSSLGRCEDDRGHSPISVFSSSQHVERLAGHDTSSLGLGSEPDFAVDKSLVAGEAQLQKEGQNCNGKSSPIGMANGSLKDETIGLQYTATLPTPGSMILDYPKQLPVVGDLMPSLSLIGCNGSEQSEYLKSFKNLQNPSSIPQLWPSLAYDGISSLSPLMEPDRMQGFGPERGHLDDDPDTAMKRYLSMDEILTLDKQFALPSKGNEDLQNCSLSSFTAVPNVSVTNQMPSLPQNTTAIPAGGCSANVKTRARARRGQATDPHSIAERLRREKIAERMRNLQELVPNSNKVNKASMLDEIIDYVKFLQLQVKVLSMSRLGAAGAVIPLITDSQPEGSSGLSLSASAGLGIDIASSPDQVAFEREVLKLMESNVTMAMQYLQSKGLCLMPIALAAAISSGKASLPGIASNERRKLGLTNGLAHDNSSSSSSSCGLFGNETHQVCFDGNLMAGRPSSNGVMVNGCNGVVTQEQVKNV